VFWSGAISIKKLNCMDVKEQCQVKIWNKFAVLKKLHHNMDNNRDREGIEKNTETVSQWYSAGLGVGWSGFESRQGLRIFLFTTVSRPVLGSTQPPIQWVPRALSLGVKRPGREADYSPSSSAEVKNAFRCTSTPQYAFRAWYCVKKAKESLDCYELKRK
jgi:hypothetical protein